MINPKLLQLVYLFYCGKITYYKRNNLWKYKIVYYLVLRVGMKGIPTLSTSIKLFWLVLIKLDNICHRLIDMYKLCIHIHLFSRNILVTHLALSSMYL